MKIKLLLRFYFSAEKLNGALDNVILLLAEKSASECGRGEYYAEKICAVIYEKARLAELYRYLEKIMSKFNLNDFNVLKFYALTRCGVKRFPAEICRKIKSAAVKFTRKARFIENYEKEVKIAGKYYCLF